jgi:uncharacterized protein (DUF2236 family)
VDLDAELERLERSCADGRAGLFGPDSEVWAVNRHAAIFLGAGRAALLQLAHPWVAQAIHDHSHVGRDPLGRFQRTFLNTGHMVFGDLEHALRASRRVHRVHDAITGRVAGGGGEYRAHDIDALLWVHSTLWETSIHTYERVVGLLPAERVERYYRETARFAALFGIPERALPPSWNAFLAYNRSMWSSLEVTPVAREIAQNLLRPRVRGVRRLVRWYTDVTAWLLPPRLRAGFGLPEPTAARARELERALARIRRIERRLPARLRYVPAYVEAQRRCAGRAGPDLLGALLTRAMVGRS